MSWTRTRRKIGIHLDSLDIKFLDHINNNKNVTLGDLKKLSKMSWSNLQIHKNRLSPLIDITRQIDNSKIVTIKPEMKYLVEGLIKVYG